jgi:hypothetical protein
MIKYFRILILLPLLTCACAGELTLDLPEEPTRVVLISHFTQTEAMRVNVSLSQPVYANNTPVLPQNIDVTISTEGQFFARLLRRGSSNGKVLFEATKLVAPEQTYLISVDVPGYPRVQASSFIPRHIPLNEVTIDNNAIVVQELSDGQKALRVPLALKLDALPANNKYFAFNLRHETEVFEVVNGQMFPDYIYEADTYFLTDGRTLSLLDNIAEPVVLINENYWNDNRRTLYLDALIPFKTETEIPRRIFIEWRTLSEDFYRYHLSLSRQGSNQPLSEPDAVYNNVSEGYGNFSGYSVAFDTIVIPPR